MHVQNLMNSLWDIRIFLGLVPKESPCTLPKSNGGWLSAVCCLWNASSKFPAIISQQTGTPLGLVSLLGISWWIFTAFSSLTARDFVGRNPSESLGNAPLKAYYTSQLCTRSGTISRWFFALWFPPPKLLVTFFNGFRSAFLTLPSWS